MLCAMFPRTPGGLIDARCEHRSVTTVTPSWHRDRVMVQDGVPGGYSVELGGRSKC